MAKSSASERQAFQVALASRPVDRLSGSSPSVTFTAGDGCPVPVRPSFSPNAGTHTCPYPVTISSPQEPDAKIYFTSDGSTPTEQSSRYTVPVTVSAAEKLQAIAVANGIPSFVATATYACAPPAICPAGQHCCKMGDNGRCINCEMWVPPSTTLVLQWDMPVHDEIV